MLRSPRQPGDPQPQHFPSPAPGQTGAATVGRISPSPALSILLMLLGACVACVGWTVPNWNTFTPLLPQWGALWQVGGNRIILVALVIRIMSPLLVALLLGGCCWLAVLVQQYSRIWRSSAAAARSRETSRVMVPMPDTSEISLQSPVPVTKERPPFQSLSLTQPALQTQADEQPDAFSMMLPGEQRHSPPTRHVSQHAQDLERRRSSRYPRSRSDEHPQLPQARAMQSAEDGESGTQEQADRQNTGEMTGSTPVHEEAAAPQGVRGGEPLSPAEPAGPLISITLLKELRVTLHLPDGTTAAVPLSQSALRTQLLAYLSWQHGTPVARDTLLEDVFGHGKSDEEASPQRLSEAFNSHRKLLRRDLRQTVATLNTAAGQTVLPADLDFFAVEQRLWKLAPHCIVSDLATIDRYHELIETARKEGALTSDIPAPIKGVCDALIAAYPGDFLGDVLNHYPDEFQPWYSSWARKPFTLYRDYYLQAVRYAAEYEVQTSQQTAEQKRQRTHLGRSAELYRTYALTACNSAFDRKVSFGGNGREPGERVRESERALRRAIAYYGLLAQTAQVDELFTAYSKQMRSLSKTWEPSKETLEDLQGAKARTNEYRLGPPSPAAVQRDTCWPEALPQSS